eukprot:TRINITY_DN16369_c0_g2_i1.p1 TRINITY_DN16369_c0_g2~~TRINITY_DN16369_c0_g2_i1.p1  ORF type:complete len:193 (+),score=6.85 TRINITY_DN16369_c0_g2_i1:24-581(+)
MDFGTKATPRRKSKRSSTAENPTRCASRECITCSVKTPYPPVAKHTCALPALSPPKSHAASTISRRSRDTSHPDAAQQADTAIRRAAEKALHQLVASQRTSHGLVKATVHKAEEYLDLDTLPEEKQPEPVEARYISSDDPTAWYHTALLRAHAPVLGVIPLPERGLYRTEPAPPPPRPVFHPAGE